MAQLTIITGTMGFRDVSGDFAREWAKHKMRREIIRTDQIVPLCFGDEFEYSDIPNVIFKKHRFDRAIIEKNGSVRILRSPIFKQKYDFYEVQQTMGCYKTGIIMEHLARVHERGGVTAANFAIKWFPYNLDKSKNKWRPNINTFEDLQKVHHVTIGFDDVKGSIESVQGETAKLGTMIVNESRKMGKDILISTQRTTNFIPPNIRAVVTNYEIPIITIRDKRLPSPDGMGYPLEVEIINVSGHYTFIGFGITDGGDMLPDGYRINPRQSLLDSYSTVEIATNLAGSGQEDLPPVNQNVEREPYSGYNNEMRVVRELQNLRKGIVHHISKDDPHRHLADIEYLNGKKWFIDVVSVNHANQKYPTMETWHKDINMYIEDAEKLGYIPLFAFNLGERVRFIKAHLLAGKAGNIRMSKEIKVNHLPAKSIFEHILLEQSR